ncbi:hypothetical protein [Fuerstiella marisgermanici]|uniref:Uncharacterized protein n=1 Tax=Fuerstiella marisgermanici TaxID=1891926 RepID=A0A1P8WBX4_9PLAN|nr:hypothetical protein [Fuerstiella marisgermanici]APZ91534.1 hypothetical protein Fuma_01122 [Fuerstiella marisgermanici]
MKWLKTIFTGGLTQQEDPGLAAVLMGLATRCFWTLLVNSFVTSSAFCVFSHRWDAASRSAVADGIDAAAQDIVGSEKARVTRMLPPEQAEFWLEAVSRLEARGDLTASEAMGAALLLDGPGFGYLSAWTSKFLLQQGSDALSEERAKLTHEFWDKCSAKCTELASQATDAEPNNRELWRLRAMLLFPACFSTDGGEVRDTNWLNILHEARKHDPDNALYDYLAAAQCWRKSAEKVYYSDFLGAYEVISDQATYDAGCRHFYRGQELRELKFPNQHRPLQLQLQVARTQQATGEASRCASEDRIQWHVDAICRKLRDHLELETTRVRREGNADFAAHIVEQQLRLAEQISDQQSGFFPRLYRRGVFAQGHQTLLQLEQSTPELTASHTPLTRYDVNFRISRQRGLDQEIGTRVMARFDLNPDERDDGTRLSAICKILLYGVGCLVIATAIWLFGRRFQLSEGVAFGWRYPVVFGGAFVVSVVFQALIPAGVLRGEIAGWTINVVGGICLVTIVVLLIRRWYFRPQKTAPVRKRIFIPAVLVLGSLYAMVLQHFSATVAWESAQPGNPWAMPPLQLPQIPVWAKAVFLWTQNRGTECSLLAGFLISSLWIVLRLRNKQPNASDRTRGKQIGRFILCWCRPTLATGLGLCTIAFLSLPAAVSFATNWEAYRVAYCSPETMQRLHNECREEVLSDIGTMQKIAVDADAYATSLQPDNEAFYLTEPVLNEEAEGADYAGGE